jgi:hypothetical protein
MLWKAEAARVAKDADFCGWSRIALQEQLPHVQSMKYPITHFKSLTVALKELEPFIRNGEHLQTGKPFKKFGGLRSREILANWLLCVALNSDGRSLTFSSDPLGGDGIIWASATGETWPTEHVMVPRLRPGETGDCEALILNAIEQKRTKGGAVYAAGKTLIVFLEAGAGIWFPNRVARQLPNPLLFAAAWVVGLHGVLAGKYVYNVTCLDISDGSAPALLVHIGRDFDSWTVSRIQ